MIAMPGVVVLVITFKVIRVMQVHGEPALRQKESTGRKLSFEFDFPVPLSFVLYEFKGAGATLCG